MTASLGVTGSRPAKLGSLEIGRFIAASVVALAHFLVQLQSFAAPGACLFWNAQLPAPIGVQYFFVLSGFVMMTAHQADFGQWRAPLKFWWRRVCRIYPAYWIGLAIMIYYFFGALTPGLAIRLIFLPPIRITDWVPPAWSLHYEFAFYIIFGLGLLPCIGRPLLAAWIISVLWLWSPPFVTQLLPALPFRFFIHLATGYGQDFYAPFEFYFFAGLLGGFVFNRFQWKRNLNLIILTVGVAILLAAAPRMDWGFAYGPPLISLLTGIGIAAVIVGLAGLERCGALAFDALASRLGAMSYPLYILHGVFLFQFEQYVEHRFQLHSFGLGLFAIFVLAVLYVVIAMITFGIDQPLQRLLRRLFREGRIPADRLRQQPVGGDPKAGIF